MDSNYNQEENEHLTVSEEPDSLPYGDYDQVESAEDIDEEIDTRETGDEELVRWQSVEYITRPKGMTWYVVFGLITVALMLIAIFVIKDISFTILIPVMTLSLLIYVRRPGSLVSYTLSRKGMHVNDRLFGYEYFRGFALEKKENENMISMIPRQRFKMAVSFDFSDEVGEAIVDILAARLPMENRKPDFIDRFVKYLGM